MGYSVMGTSVKSGPHRAREAAIEALASPLLEAGAIHGARGILINITGSSSLKLNEVNEASLIIQEASHEDANIIFGAVLDERMGEEVKFTVIATGFRDDMPARRERMMAGTALPTAHLPPPPPRIMPRPPAEPAAPFASEAEPVAAPVIAEEPVAPKPMFASEAALTQALAEPVYEPVEAAPEPVVAEQAPVVETPVATLPVAETPRQSFPVSSYYEAARQQAWQEPAPRIEFVSEEEVHHTPPAVVFESSAGFEPVPVHEEPVQEGYVEDAPEPVRQFVEAPVVVEHIPEFVDEPVAEAAPAEPELRPVAASVFDDDFFRRPKPEADAAPVHEETHWPAAKVPSFAGYAGDTPSETDELDIPAFLRRNH